MLVHDLLGDSCYVLVLWNHRLLQPRDDGEVQEGHRDRRIMSWRKSLAQKSNWEKLYQFNT